MKRLVLPLLAGLALAGCNTPTPYPNGTPFRGAYVSANQAPRGSAAFCRTYARQTAANRYESSGDARDGFGSRAMDYYSARDAGDRAYRRCLAGRTN